MKNNLTLEIQKIVEGKKLTEVKLPMPTYLYVQRYGRNIENEMEEITGLLGESQYFVFKAGRIPKENTVLRGFLMELEKNAPVGKEFAGCVLVELSEEEERDQLVDFLDYVSRQKNIKCIFTIQAKQDEAGIRRLLEQYFFVRVVEGQKYECEEQIAIIESVFDSYGFHSDEEVGLLFAEFFAQREWKETDMVENRVRNIARNLVYEKVIEPNTNDFYISAEAAENMLQKMQKDLTGKKAIGFCCD